jgi:hypothetical protein
MNNSINLHQTDRTAGRLLATKINSKYENRPTYRYQISSGT